MTDTDVDDLHTRRSQQDADSIAVDMADMRSHSLEPTSASVEYPNPFHQPQPQYHHTQQQHYSIHIPTVNHWPTLLIQHTRKGIKLVYESIQRLRDHSYQSLPSSEGSRNPFHTSRFGSRRHSQEAGHSSSCSGRRFNRILILLSLIVFIMTWVLLPTTLKPFQNRDVWVRFFDHEEAVKIVLPYRQRIHVYDVKKIALKEMDAGYTSHNPENVRLLSDVGNGLLRPDEVWDNELYHSSAYHPILAVETRYELFSYLNRTLGCFSDIRAFGNNIYEIKFQPQFNDYQPLSYILHSIRGNTVTNWQVQYLRRAFNDPLKDAAYDNAEYWSRPKDVLQDSQPWYIHPQPSMISIEPWPNVEPLLID